VILVRPAEFFCFVPHIIIPITRLIPCSHTHTHTHIHTHTRLPECPRFNRHAPPPPHAIAVYLPYPSRRDIYYIYILVSIICIMLYIMYIIYIWRRINRTVTKGFALHVNTFKGFVLNCRRRLDGCTASRFRSVRARRRQLAQEHTQATKLYNIIL